MAIIKKLKAVDKRRNEIWISLIQYSDNFITLSDR